MRLRSVASASLAVAGAILLLVLLFISWYAITIQVSGLGIQGTSTANLQLGTVVTQTESCTGSPLCPASTSNSTTYSDLKWNDTGNLYEAMQYLTIAGAVVGFAGAAFALFRNDRSSRARSLVIAILLIATVLAIVVPLTLLVYQPTAMNNDGVYRNVTTARDFFGSCSGSACGVNTSATITASWGPTSGWDLAFVAFGFLLAALLLAAYRVPPPETQLASVPTAGDARGAEPGPPTSAPSATGGLIACRKCGHVYPSGTHRFCPNCGAELEPSPAWTET